MLIKGIFLHLIFCGIILAKVKERSTSTNNVTFESHLPGILINYIIIACSTA